MTAGNPVRHGRTEAAHGEREIRLYNNVSRDCLRRDKRLRGQETSPWVELRSMQDQNITRRGQKGAYQDAWRNLSRPDIVSSKSKNEDRTALGEIIRMNAGDRPASPRLGVLAESLTS